MSEAQKASRRAEEAEARGISGGAEFDGAGYRRRDGLPYGASKFIGGQSEEEMRVSAGELKGLGWESPPRPLRRFAPPPLKGRDFGNSTAIVSASAPARAVELPVDDQIAAAYKSGNQAEAIRFEADEGRAGGWDRSRGEAHPAFGHLPCREGKVYGQVKKRLTSCATLYFLPYREGGLKGRMGSERIRQIRKMNNGI